MCRLFGFKSVIQSQVHHSLYEADNALLFQSKKHPDGWGVAYYVSGCPHIIKSNKTAFEDTIFSKVSGIVSSETVVAHVRNATHGDLNILNTHPFQYANWIFAHNGNIKNFKKHRKNLIDKIAPQLRRFILGDTDSELIFYFILTYLSGHIDLSKTDCSIDTLSQGVREAVDDLINEVGPYSETNKGPEETYLNFILTNGVSIIAHHGGKKLYYSTYKTRCADRDGCPHYSMECENPTQSGFINHLVFSSEPLQGDNIWLPMKSGDLIGADWKMKLSIIEKQVVKL